MNRYCEICGCEIVPTQEEDICSHCQEMNKKTLPTPQGRTPRRGGRIILNEILTERARQDAKWGEQNHHPLKWLAILGEEVGEANKAILESSLLRYRDELIQVAAVAVAAVEALDRGKWRMLNETE